MVSSSTATFVNTLYQVSVLKDGVCNVETSLRYGTVSAETYEERAVKKDVTRRIVSAEPADQWCRGTGSIVHFDLITAFFCGEILELQLDDLQANKT